MLDVKKANLQSNFALFFSLILLTLAGSSGAIAGGDSIGQKIRALNEENRLLEAEATLASTGTTYVILELRTEPNSVPVRINLKNRGLLLREFDAERIRYRRTKPLVTEPIPLIKKTAFFPMRRKEIRPHKPEEGPEADGEMDFLELKDMPSNYTLIFGRRLFISVKSQPKGFIPRFAYLIRSIFIHIRNSLAVVWNRLWNNEFAIIEVRMRGEEAQSLYWSLEQGMNVVVRTGYPDGTV